VHPRHIASFGDGASGPEEKFMTPRALKTPRDMKGVGLPVLQSTKFELVISLQTAKTLDIHVPSDVRV
jgi:hypothetical protein